MSEEIKQGGPETAKPENDAAADASAEAAAIIMGDESAEAASEGKGRRSRGRSIPAGIAHITASFNNTAVAISDARGNIIAWSTSGRAGFKGSRKSTAFAGTMVAQDCGRQAVAKGMHEVEVRVQGVGAGRDSAVRGLASAGLTVSVLKDVTPIAHNGCRARKRRRV